jgi:phosphocarrier protein
MTAAFLLGNLHFAIRISQFAISSSGSVDSSEHDAMNGPPLRRTVLITSPQGFHMRPIKAFVELAQQFQCAVTVGRDGREVNGKSMMDMMLMLSPPGSELVVTADGSDAAPALEALLSLIAKVSAEEEAAEPS